MPSCTASMILSKGTTSYLKSELKIRSARNALVNLPGIAIFRFGMSARRCRFARDDDRAVVVANRSAVRQQRIFVVQCTHKRES